MWHWWCLSWLKMIVLLNNKREEIDRAVFYCVSQNVNLVEIKHFSYGQKSDTVSTLRQSPCSSLVTFVPCPRKRVFVASSAFLELFCHIMFKLHLLYQAFKLFRLGNLPHRFPVAEFFLYQPTLLSKSPTNSFSWRHIWFFNSPDKGTDPDAAVGCLETVSLDDLNFPNQILPTSASIQTWQSSCSCWCSVWSAWRGSTSAQRWKSYWGPLWLCLCCLISMFTCMKVKIMWRTGLMPERMCHELQPIGTWEI